MKLACLSGWKWHLEKYRLDLVKAPVSQMFLTVFCISVSFFIRWKIIQTNSRSFGERPSQNSYLCTLVILGDPWWSLVQWEAHGRKLCRCVAEGFVQWSGTRTWSGALGFAFSQDQHSGKQKNDPLKIEYIVLVHIFFSVYMYTCMRSCGYCILYIYIYSIFMQGYNICILRKCVSWSTLDAGLSCFRHTAGSSKAWGWHWGVFSL